MTNDISYYRALTRDVSPLINISKIITVFYFEFGDSFVGGKECHDFHELVYVDKGCILQTIGDVAYEMVAGDCVLIRPNDAHQLYAYLGTKPNVFIITFVSDSRAFQSLENKLCQLPRHLYRYISDIILEARYTYAAPCFESNMPILRESDDELPGGEQMIRTSLEQLFINLYRTFVVNRDLPDLEVMEEDMDETPNDVVNQIIHYIRDNPQKPLTPSSICDMYKGYSKNYLSTLFRRYCGCNLVDYIHRMKIKEAKRLIRQGRYNLSGIANLLCYSDQHYFSRVFRRVTGMSPSEYQKSLLLH